MTNEQMIDSTSDARVANNVMRHEYKVLDANGKVQMKAVKDMGLEFWNLVDGMGSSRDLSLAKTHIEDAVMRAVRHITG
jgi:hypothetical protein